MLSFQLAAIMDKPRRPQKTFQCYLQPLTTNLVNPVIINIPLISLHWAFFHWLFSNFNPDIRLKNRIAEIVDLLEVWQWLAPVPILKIEAMPRLKTIYVLIFSLFNPITMMLDMFETPDWVAKRNQKKLPQIYLTKKKRGLVFCLIPL